MTERNSRWITVRAPFNFYWPSRAVTHFSEADFGEHLVKNELADFAVEGGYATEGKLDGSAKSRKGRKPRKSRAKTKKGPATAKTADTPAVASVGDEGASDADRPADRPAVDSDAS